MGGKSFREKVAKGLVFGKEVDFQEGGESECLELRRESNHVFFGGNEEGCIAFCRNLQHHRQVGSAVLVMVRESKAWTNDNSGLSEQMIKALGSGDAGKGDRLLRMQGCKRDAFTAKSHPQPGETMNTGINRFSREQPGDLRSRRLGQLSIFGTREHNGIRAVKVCRRFPQRTQGQQGTIPEGVMRIKQDQIQVAIQRQVLKAVIQDQGIHVIVLNGLIS